VRGQKIDIGKCIFSDQTIFMVHIFFNVTLSMAYHEIFIQPYDGCKHGSLKQLASYELSHIERKCE